MKKTCNNRLFFSLFFLLICISLFVTGLFKVDPDYLWHIKAGEYMFHNGLLRHDVFSWFVSSKYWMSHEWLFEIFIYSLKYLFGKYHIFIYLFFSNFLLGLILFFPNKKKYMKNIPFTLLWFLFFLIIIVFSQVRPHMISFSLFALTFYFLYELHYDENSKKIYFLPLISVFWANFHGGSSNLPYLLCFIFLISGLFSFKFPKIEAKRISKKQIFKYLGIGLLCMLCVCLNLHGFKMFIYPYENMANTTMIHSISEWQSTSLNDFTSYIYFALLLFIVLILLFSKKKIRFIDFIIFLFVAYLGLKSIRFWFYTYIVMSYIIFDYVPEIKKDKGTILCILLFSSFFLIVFIVNIKNVFEPKFEFLLEEKDIEAIQEANPKRLFNLYDFGGELIYNDILVFIDGRADLYSNYNYSDSINITYLKGDFVKIIEKYDFDYFIVLEDYPINTYLKYNNFYEKIYQNKDVLLYKKVN